MIKAVHSKSERLFSYLAIPHSPFPPGESPTAMAVRESAHKNHHSRRLVSGAFPDAAGRPGITANRPFRLLLYNIKRIQNNIRAADAAEKKISKSLSDSYHHYI